MKMNEVTRVFKDFEIIYTFLTKFRYLLSSHFVRLIGFSSIKKILNSREYIYIVIFVLREIILNNSPLIPIGIKKENSLSCREELNMMTRNFFDHFRKVQRFFVVAHPERKHVAGAKSNEMG